ncbi:MAG TPA: FxSxx-COOH system tetratricopeptide repeat protein [Pyrinomonadaceae bacterium]|nr:FxSxx-COOH system tetratricopeptide repeat protein [Pyrinomonadaceae bacterium]
MENDFTVFISYAHEDNDSPDPSKRWLNRLLQQLQPLVFQKQVRTWSDTAIETGERWHESIRTQLHNAKVAVLLVSPAFLASDYIRNTEIPLLLKAQSRGVIILPIILRRCLFTATRFKYPDPINGPEEVSLSIFQSANSPDKPLNAMQEHEQDEVLVSVAERILKLTRSTLSASLSQGTAAASGREKPTNTPAIWNIPHPRNPFFTGRAQLLDRLHRELIATGKAALSLSGMGGVGKTQTAVEYAYLHRGEYRAVLWITANTEDSLKAGFAAIAAELNLPEKDAPDRDVVVSTVKRWLKGNAGWLLILDNADDLGLVSDMLEGEWGGHVLLTTRARAMGRASQVEIREMTAEEGTLFLLRRAKLIAIDDALGAATDADRELAAEITQEVGGLPLALDQAGAFVEEMSSNLSEYLELYRREGAKLMAQRGGAVADHESVTITFSLAFREVARTNAALADMLRACAFLAPDAIPEEIFVSGAGELGEKLASMVGGGINLVKMIAEGVRFSLIRRNMQNGTIEIHRLVQQVLKDEMDEKTRQFWAERVVRTLNKSFPQVEPQNWPLCEKLLPHAQEAAGLIEEYGFEFYEAARLLNQAGYYCTERAQYGEAEALYIRSLSIREKTLGSEHPSVTMGLNNLAILYKKQGKYLEAETLHMRALNIREKVLGLEHPDVATSLNNLALLYHDQGKYAEAEPLYIRALNIYEKVLGPEHPDMATSLNNLALLYKKQGKYAEAEPLYVRALNIREKVLDPGHPDLAGSLNNLAILYKDQGKYAEAEPLYMRSLNIREKVLGPEHPSVATGLNNLAILYKDQGKYAEAEPLYIRALNIREKVLGPEHPDLAGSLNNLAFFYENQGKYTEAEPLYVRALSIYEKVLTPEHPHTSLVRKNYADLLQKIQIKTEE